MYVSQYCGKLQAERWSRSVVGYGSQPEVTTSTGVMTTFPGKPDGGSIYSDYFGEGDCSVSVGITGTDIV